MQVLTSASMPNTENNLFCFYTNQTNQVQILRISDRQNGYFERVVFPGQRLIFEAEPTAFLEVHTGTIVSSILSDKIPCSKIQVQVD